MQKAIKAFVVVSSLVFGSAHAATASIDYAEKNKVASPQLNTVIGLSVADKVTVLNQGVTTELRVEDELVQGISPKKHEGLVQLKGSTDLYKFTTVVPVTFYGAGAVGLKSKVDNSFKYYVAAVGVKTTVAGVGLDLASRIRSPFNEGHNGTGSKYRTVENSLTASYAVTKDYTVGVKFARERGDSNYDTTGVSIKRSF
jgi:hypothetical protein